ncbi:hypothetical protein RRF57_009239 [Xylaria bambusicola]|uniref:Uncharacterized protein n=1 Tax=Xylaria bambusicola TaxID=326684 RepID=A0AAN7UJ89_9PEZI
MYLRFCDFEVSNLDTTRSEIGDLKFHLDGPLGALGVDAAHAAAKATRHTASVLVVSLHAGQS